MLLPELFEIPEFQIVPNRNTFSALKIKGVKITYGPAFTAQCQ